MDKREEAKKRIENYIKANDYTWKISDLIEEYKKKNDGYYISFTAKNCINQCKKEFELLNNGGVKSGRKPKK